MAQKTLENELKELENIVARLSSEELPLEEAIALYTCRNIYPRWSCRRVR